MDIRFLFRSAQGVLAGARRVLTVSHRKPDGDALGSTTAFINFCLGRGIAVTAFCADPPPEQYAYLPGIERFTSDRSVFQDRGYDALVVFDSGDLRYAGVADLVAGMPRRPVMISFDHHATNERYADINVVDAGASSTAEVIYNYLLDAGAVIDPDLATCLLTGIYTDTDSFTNPATTDKALRAASYLIGRGAQIQTISIRLTHNKSLPSLRLWGQVFSRLKFDEALGIASTAVFCEDCAGVGDDQVEGMANFLNNFLESKVVLVLKEVPGGLVKGSFRTAAEIDVSAVAKQLGGGGHRKAAGFTIPGRIAETASGWRVE